MPALVQDRAELLSGLAIEFDGGELGSNIGLLLVILILGQSHQLIGGAGKPDGSRQKSLLVIVGSAEVRSGRRDIALQLESIRPVSYTHLEKPKAKRPDFIALLLSKFKKPDKEERCV